MSFFGRLRRRFSGGCRGVSFGGRGLGLFNDDDAGRSSGQFAVVESALVRSFYGFRSEAVPSRGSHGWPPCRSGSRGGGGGCCCSASCSGCLGIVVHGRRVIVVVIIGWRRGCCRGLLVSAAEDAGAALSALPGCEAPRGRRAYGRTHAQVADQHALLARAVQARLGRLHRVAVLVPLRLVEAAWRLRCGGDLNVAYRHSVSEGRPGVGRPPWRSGLVLLLASLLVRVIWRPVGAVSGALGWGHRNLRNGVTLAIGSRW